MKQTRSFQFFALFIALGLTSCVGVWKKNTSHNEKPSDAIPCKTAGPQTPRDIDSKIGTNKIVFPVAPIYSELNLCNIHFHVNAEHKGENFSLEAGAGDHGHGGGYKCTDTPSLTKEELKSPNGSICEGLKPGDTIEVHWVHSSCGDVQPGETLKSCLSEKCQKPSLRVEAQVFLVVNDPTALNFNDLSYDGNIVNGRHQAKAIPAGTGIPVEFLGSTTGEKYNNEQCSPLQVTWNVRPQCAKVDINSLGKWCEHNVFKEHHGHGARELVTDPSLLSEIK
ncbi:delta-class carbonic anhydrase [Candidatus Electronema sp. PJ]|uniref:delta-class carbonic anhydrase n=1 Tax=Candidatus Electronema sp. PJ TaxID=3401572 RepID=UPI003AA9696F